MLSNWSTCAHLSFCATWGFAEWPQVASAGVWWRQQGSSSGFWASLWTAVATPTAGAAAARQTPTDAPPALRELSFEMYKHFFYLGGSLSSHLLPSPLLFLFHPLLCAGSAFGITLICIDPLIVAHSLQTPEMTGSNRGGGTEMQVQAVRMWHLLITAISRLPRIEPELLNSFFPVELTAQKCPDRFCTSFSNLIWIHTFG